LIIGWSGYHASANLSIIHYHFSITKGILNFTKIRIMFFYDTVVEAITALRQRGYTLDFNLAFDQVQCQAEGICLNPAEFEISEHYRFEGDTNPSDEDIVYAIASMDGRIKGVLTSAYGMYADNLSPAMLKKLHFKIK
jgi:hypothetical protein